MAGPEPIIIPNDWGSVQDAIGSLSRIIDENTTLSSYLPVNGTRAMTGQYFYLKGDADTNGSVRFNTASGTTRLEIRIAGSWKGTTWP